VCEVLAYHEYAVMVCVCTTVYVLYVCVCADTACSGCLEVTASSSAGRPWSPWFAVICHTSV